MNDKPLRGIDVLRENNNRTGRENESGTAVARKDPVYPISAERELARVNLAYTNYVIKLSQPYIDQIMRQYEERSYRQDSICDFISTVRSKIRAIAEKLSGRTKARRSTEKGISRAGKLAERRSVDDWHDQVKDATGLEVDKKACEEDMNEMVQNWIRQNVSMIQSVPSEYLTDIENIIRWGYETRQPKVNVYRRLEKQIGLTRSKAVMIARDQLGTLYYQMTRHEQESAGVSRYIWITKKDDRVRDSHRELHGTIQSWNAPPPMWYWTESRGRVYTGRYCHPGEDFGCRCRAKPVFDLEGAKELLAQKFRPL